MVRQMNLHLRRQQRPHGPLTGDGALPRHVGAGARGGGDAGQAHKQGGVHPVRKRGPRTGPYGDARAVGEGVHRSQELGRAGVQLREEAWGEGIQGVQLQVQVECQEIVFPIVIPEHNSCSGTGTCHPIS